MKEIVYKGYKIAASPDQLLKTKEWTTNVTITKISSNHVSMKSFSSSNTFKTEDEAIIHCFDFGRKIIDGHFDDCTVADLE